MAANKAVDGLVLVEVETDSYTFRGVGRSEVEARRALKTAWDAHVAQTGADPEYVDATEDGNVYALRAGQGWRDDEVLTRRREGR